jgi:aldose 1-epimerase
MYKHVISINADTITETDDESIPTGKFTNVDGTPFDLRISREIGPTMRNVNGPGYDNNFCVNVPKGSENSLNFVSR